MTYKITPKGELVIDKHALFSSEETKRIFKELDRRSSVLGYPVEADPSMKVKIGCLNTTLAEIDAFCAEYKSGSWHAPAWNPENRKHIPIGTSWTIKCSGDTYMLIGTPDENQGLIVNVDTGVYRHRIHGGNTHYPADVVDKALHDGSAFTLIKYGIF